MRLDAVEEIVQTEDIYNAIRMALRAINKMDLDKLIISVRLYSARIGGNLINCLQIITINPEHQISNPRDASSHVQTLLSLRNMVRCIPAIRRALESAGCAMLCTIAQLLQDHRLSQVESLLAAGLNDDAGMAKVWAPSRLQCE